MSARNAGDLGSIPGSGRSPGEGNGNPLQYPCLENPLCYCGPLITAQKPLWVRYCELHSTLASGFPGFPLTFSVPGPDPGTHVAFSCVSGCFSLWQSVRVPLFLKPWQFWGVHPSIWGCLRFFLVVRLRLWGRKTSVHIAVLVICQGCWLSTWHPFGADLDHLAEVLFVSSVDWKLLCLPLSTPPSLEASH